MYANAVVGRHYVVLGKDFSRLRHPWDVEGHITSGTALGKPSATRGRSDFHGRAFPWFQTQLNPEARVGHGKLDLPLQQQCGYTLQGLAKVSALSLCTSLSDRHHCHMCVAVLFLLFPSWQVKSWRLPKYTKDIGRMWVVWHFLLVDAADFGGRVKRESCACCWLCLLFAIVISTCHYYKLFSLCKHVAC